MSFFTFQRAKMGGRDQIPHCELVLTSLGKYKRQTTKVETLYIVNIYVGLTVSLTLTLNLSVQSSLHRKINLATL